MKSNKKGVRALACAFTVAAVAGASLVTAPAGHAATGDTVAFSPIALAIPALQQVAAGFKAIETGLGNTPLVVDPNFDAQKQAQQLTQLIKSGKIQGAWAIAVKPVALSTVVRLAQKKGVPMVLNGVPKDYGFSGPQKGLAFARIDYNKMGAAMGATLGQCINERLGGKAEVIYMTSTAGTAGREEQDAATKKWLAKTAPGATIVQTIEVKDRAGAQQDVAAALQAHPNVKAITGANDEGALGALSAYAAAGKTLTCVTENGGNDEVLAAVKAGKIYASAAIQFAEGVQNDLMELDRLMKNPTAVGKLLSEPLKIYKS